MKNIQIVILIFTVTACPSLAFADKADKIEADLAQPTDCSTAEGDIRVLESEKIHAGKQLLKGVQSVAPAGIVLGALTRKGKKNRKMATGKYNKLIEQKIKDIKKQCGIEEGQDE